VITAVAAVVASSVAAVPARAAATFVVLQMNLCNSGMAVTSCYSSGRAVDEAVEKIHRYPPDLVTLQEVCRDDLFARDGWGKVAAAMADRYGSRSVTAEFVPAWNPYRNEGYRCVNGEQYGVGLIHRGNGRGAHHGWYDSQDSSDEWRAWTCATVIRGRLTGCTTHLSTEPDVAMRQCRELMTVLTSPWVMPEVVVAGDFNLLASPTGPHSLQNCEPADYHHRNDDAVQQVLFSSGIRWVQGRQERMKWTDHPLLYQRFRV